MYGPAARWSTPAAQIGRLTSIVRVGKGWMETYEAPSTIEVDENLRRG